MQTLELAPEIRNACRIHARLLDQYIDLIRTELDKQTCSFAQESLRETLENARADRRNYGTMAGLVAVDDAA